MLYTVADVNMEASCVIIDVTNYDLGVGVVITLNGFNVKFTLEHSSYIDGDDGDCQLKAKYWNWFKRCDSGFGREEANVNVASAIDHTQIWDLANAIVAWIWEAVDFGTYWFTEILGLETAGKRKFL